MRRSTTQLTPQIEEWTEEEVHQWLTTVVKVHDIFANKFTEEEVSGNSLVVFTKTDILDLGIKHGPAVKITSHLESLKDGSQRKEFPAFALSWTKEQVSQWLVQHVKIYGKYAERLQEEDVSGDCLVCFKKQDFLDLGVKSGPAVRILDQLNQLSKNPEPTLQPIPHTSSDQKEPPDLGQLELSHTRGSNQAEPNKSTKTDQTRAKESGMVQLEFKKEPKERKLPQLKAQNFEASRTETETPGLSGLPSITVAIQETLEELNNLNFKKFQFYLKEFAKDREKPIPQSELEGKDRMDTAKLITDCYGSEEAVIVTIKILQNIKQKELVCLLGKKIGRQQQQRLSKTVAKKEANQGDKLKNLLTCGGNSLDNYKHLVIVVNKSSAEQVQYLQFLNKLRLFCVLDFDPNSNTPEGLCHSYRDSRWANLHTPSQYQGQIESVIKDLNLYKQTSWVFCNGRHDLDSDSNNELDFKNWLRKTCRDVEQMISFICNPEVLLHKRSLIIFLLLSPVNSEKNPVFDIYRAFLKHIEEEMIIHICESQSTYEKWREMIQEKCDFDIEPLSVYELSLSEVNGTIMALGPLSESSERLLPSTDSSFVVLKKKDEDLLTALDILCLNQCENIYEENSPEFHSKKKKVEEEFYRGGKVKWWNFFFCDKDKQKPFIKRDKYENVKKKILGQLRESKDLCTLLNLFHHPGCGGTTLAMHVMWDLRKEIRCAVLKDNELPMTEVAVQVVKLMKLESEKPCPVLLLVDDSKETENPYELVNCIPQAVATYSNINVSNAQSCKVIVLNCVRSHNPKEQYKRHNQPSQYITASLTPEEQEEFEKKLKDLKETHEKPENFYSFMIMKSNFDKKYIEDLARNTLENFDSSSKKDRLFAYVALINTYEAESEISCSLSEDFLGMNKIRWQDESALDRMEPYSNLLIIERVEDWGEYKGIRILHPSIASACLEELERSYSLKVSGITLEILHCDLFFSHGVVKQRLMDSIQHMLIIRQHKKDGVERELFSPLINKIHCDEGRQTVQQVFEKASSRFEKSASIPQALARYLYINERDFPEALKWAEKAKKIKGNPYTLDTIGQIHKTNLKSNIQREKQETSNNPEDLDTNIKIAINAITAFKKAQELANAEDEPEEEAIDDESDDYPRKSYNVKGYVGVLEIVFLVFEVLSRLPFFEKSDPLKRKYFKSFLEKAMPITSVYQEDNKTNKTYKEIIKGHEYFLQNLKMETKTTFDLLDNYFTYVKRSISEFQSKNHWICCNLFKEYVGLFCTEPEELKNEQQKNPNLNLTLKTEEQRLYLEKNQADTFSGILQRLDKPIDEIERITECYALLQKHQHLNKKQKTKETINYILSNIVLYLLKPNSKHVKSHTHLSGLLLTTLQDVGHGYPFPDPYYLALLLFWPSQTEVNTEILTYVRAIRNSSHKHLKSFQKRSTVAHLYLGKEMGLKRLVSKPQLDKNFKIPRETLAQLWRTGDIFRERKIINCLQRVLGTIEQGEVFAHYEKLKIPVRPAHIGHVTGGHSTERVSFYLGFAINGPLAYDIHYEN
ncbi:sterile alpha motif domain-containing protein 9-like [Halichoeres trimaculatus]|uniref:sterile alpha motif domain-containing protein 9-like n=1 Tax=Halichoeres trimaculatus TaxID=147232 RepID=UPI003D9E79A7